MLTYYGQTNQRDRLREWYDGYLFGNAKVYNPWSVTNYVKAFTAAPDELPAPCIKALDQIREKKYDSWLPEEGYSEVWNYGILFYRKQCKMKAEHRYFL